VGKGVISDGLEEFLEKLLGIHRDKQLPEFAGSTFLPRCSRSERGATVARRAQARVRVHVASAGERGTAHPPPPSPPDVVGPAGPGLRDRRLALPALFEADDPARAPGGSSGDHQDPPRSAEFGSWATDDPVRGASDVVG